MEICKQCGKVVKSTRKGLCKKHYEQLLKFGKCLDSNPRTKYDPNEYKIIGNYVEVYTYNKYNEIDFTFLIDLEDLPYIINYKWNHTRLKETSDGNLVYMVNKELGLFHRFIMGNPKGTVDHITRNTLDNRKSNLRVASYTQQNMNTCVSSKRFDIKGIDIHKDIKRTKRYMARFTIKGKTYRSPWYLTYEEAVYSRYLLQQLSDIPVFNNDMSIHINKLSDKQKFPILTWFRNRFKNRV